MIAPLWRLFVAMWIGVGGTFVLYRLLLAAAYFFTRPAPPVPARRQGRLLVLIPAWNEEERLGALLDDLERQSYPGQYTTTIVLADRCTDGTAAVAAGRGVRCLEHAEPGPRLKETAIAWFIEKHGAAGHDAVCILDADCRIGPGFLDQINCALQSGAEVVQAGVGSSGPDGTWLSRITELSLNVQSRLWYEPRARLGLPGLVLGTGVCLRADRFVELSRQSLSDWDLSVRLTLGNAPVRFVPAARIDHPFPATLPAAYAQRLRWSRVRSHGLRRHGWPIVRRVLERPGFRSFDEAMLLLMPPSSWLLNWNLLAFALTWLPFSGSGTRGPAAFVLVLEAALAALGIAASERRVDLLRACLRLPLYLLWKGAIDLRSLSGRTLPSWSKPRSSDIRGSEAR